MVNNEVKNKHLKYSLTDTNTTTQQLITVLGQMRWLKKFIIYCLTNQISTNFKELK